MLFSLYVLELPRCKKTPKNKAVNHFFHSNMAFRFEMLRWFGDERDVECSETTKNISLCT